jgi:hypothetical protein
MFAVECIDEFGELPFDNLYLYKSSNTFAYGITYAYPSPYSSVLKTQWFFIIE